MRILIIAILMGLAGCSMPEKPAFHPTENRTNVKLTIIKKDNLPPPIDAPHRKAYGYYYCYTDKKCTIWIPTGDSACAKEVKKHEKKHVEFGYYHDDDFSLKECG